MPSPIIWDACSLLNLLATDRSEQIISNLGVRSFVANKVLRDEVLYLRRYPPDDENSLEEVRVSPLIDAGLLTGVDLRTDEFHAFVDLAAQMDDGEAQSLAIATSRGFTIATDDRIPIRVAREQVPPVDVITTPEWLSHWAKSVGVADVRDAVQRVEVRARFKLKQSNPHYAWWQSQII